MPSCRTVLAFVPALALWTASAAMAAAPPAFTRPASWNPYLRDPATGIEKGLAVPLEKIPDRDWLGLQWTDYRGPRLRVAVMPVDDKAPILPGGAGSGAAAVASAVGVPLQQLPVNAVEDLLGSALQDCHRFRLLERKAMEGLMEERRLQNAVALAQAQALPSPGTPLSANPVEAQRQTVEMAAKGPLVEQATQALSQKISAIASAKLMGAQYLVYASITEWVPDVKKRNFGGGGLLPGVLGTAAYKGTMAEVAMTFRVVDSATGEVIQQLDERGQAENWGFSVLGIGFGANSGVALGADLNTKAPVNYALRACIKKAAYRIARGLEDRPWRGAVIKMGEGGKVYINAGKDLGLEPGMVLNALALGEALKDPATGEILDAETREAGRITLAEVRDRISVGTFAPLAPNSILLPGDRVTMGATKP